MINNILYATDLGLYAPYLMEHVLSLASKHEAKVHAVHAIEPMGIFAESILSTYMPSHEVQTLRRRGYTEVMDKIREQVERAFADEFSDCRYDINLIEGIEVVNGKPAQVILETAQGCNADLIVMGCSSQASEGSMIGSVASAVLAQSTVPVFLIPLAKLQNPHNLRLYG